MSRKARANAVAAIMEDPKIKVILLSTKAGGVGLVRYVLSLHTTRFLTLRAFEELHKCQPRHYAESCLV